MAKFKPGESGNPQGRPAGQTPGAKIRAAIEKESSEILAAVIIAAKNGDMAAARMLMDRIVPPLKPTTAAVQLPGTISQSLAAQGASVISATLSGSLPPDSAQQLLSALAAQARITEVTELVSRIEALEQAHGRA